MLVCLESADANVVVRQHDNMAVCQYDVTMNNLMYFSLAYFNDTRR